MAQLKLIFTGPVGAGKTTAMRSISDVPLIETDVSMSDTTLSTNASTKVAMDYGVINSQDGEKIHLYGTPGQEPIDYMSDLLDEGEIGLVLLLDNSRDDPFRDMWFFLEAFKKVITDSNIAIGITHMDINNKTTIAVYNAQLLALDLNPPIFAVDPRNTNEVSLLVQALLHSLDSGLAESSWRHKF
jgi:uncharacterized protein